MIEMEEIHLKMKRRGKLRVFFGFAAGVGKTYGMLAEAHELYQKGKKIAIGYIEPHNRPDTNRLLEGLPEIERKKLTNKQMELFEPDVDRIIEEDPEIVLIDELAHTNAEGSRNVKRFQDVEELLIAGIDVFTTLNVQHLESLNDIVEEVTGIRVRETVPDIFLRGASIKVVDVEPDELIDRLEKGKIYTNENAKRALQNFFIPQKLDQLRSLAIQRAADHIHRSIVKTKGMQSVLLTVVYDSYPRMAEKCIRWTARLAEGIGAKWTVLQVRTHESSISIMSLAEKLGAEVMTIEEDNHFEAIVEYARIKGVTDLIIGKNLNQPWYEKLFFESFDNRLLRTLSETELHLIPFQENKSSFVNKSQDFMSNRSKDSLITLCGVLAATLVTSFMEWINIGEQNLILVYIFFILIIARTTTGYFWSALFSILCVLTFNWFFVEPLYSFTVYKQGYPITLFIMLIVALVISNLVVRLKKQADHSLKREHQMEILYELNKRYLIAVTRHEIFEITATYLSRLLNREVILFDGQANVESVASPIQSESLSDKDEAAVAYWVAKNQKEAGYGTDTLRGSKGLYLPILSNRSTLAVLGVEHNATLVLDNDQLNYLKLIMTQISVLLEQTELKEEKEQMERENERERIRSTLLRSVSHDLRTPLTSISGIAETLISTSVNEATRLKLYVDIREESDWLFRIIENLLSITRINMDTMKVIKTPEPVEEIMESVLKHLKKVYPTSNVATHLPEEICFIQVDPILMEQAIFNIVENAIRHGNPLNQIEITVSRHEEHTLIEIVNDGEIPLHQYKKIQSNLDYSNEVPVDSKNGLGIGLSIVKTIIHAHNGKMGLEVGNGKTKVRFYLE